MKKKNFSAAQSQRVALKIDKSSEFVLDFFYLRYTRLILPCQNAKLKAL